MTSVNFEQMVKYRIHKQIIYLDRMTVLMNTEIASTFNLIKNR